MKRITFLEVCGFSLFWRNKIDFDAIKAKENLWFIRSEARIFISPTMNTNESDFKQKISEFRRQNRKEFRTDTMEFAPLRTFEDFVLTTNRFQVKNQKLILFKILCENDLNFFQLPKFNDEERWFNRIVYNLMYYQTNYLLSAIFIFFLVLTWRPQEMIVGLMLMVRAFKNRFSTKNHRKVAEIFPWNQFLLKNSCTLISRNFFFIFRHSLSDSPIIWLIEKSQWPISEKNTQFLSLWLFSLWVTISSINCPPWSFSHWEFCYLWFSSLFMHLAEWEVWQISWPMLETWLVSIRWLPWGTF